MERHMIHVDEIAETENGISIRIHGYDAEQERDFTSILTYEDGFLRGDCLDPKKDQYQKVV
ncbi:hypothetical protein [Paenibacillus sp. D9]|uniref:hypothetical protein n=1 Tax=Paenibacillus sp. D9 TaxID=665792 RepID=UPI000A6323F6|nr:hypothetical protein [Paenibacillus sp. D9]